MNLFFTRIGALALAFSMTLGAFPTQWVYAQVAAPQASADEVKEIQHLAQAGYLAKGTAPDVTASSLTEDQVVDALLAMRDRLMTVDLKNFPGSNSTYKVEDLQALLVLVRHESSQIRARKESSWLYENRLKKMIHALTPMTPTPGVSPSPTATLSVPTVTPTVTPVPGPTFADLNALQDKIKGLNQNLTDLQLRYDQRLQDEASDDQLLKTKDQQREDEMKLVNNLLDTYESNLQKMNQRMDQISDKADQKTITAESLNQELTILQKDLQDNTQDLTILKQQMAQLEAPQQVPQDALDDFLSSKWLAGGALLVGLAALTVAVTKK
ncbi:MAG: hypothetical protein ACREL1_01840 [bacterium]